MLRMIEWPAPPGNIDLKRGSNGYYGAWTKLTADQPRGKNLSYDNNNTAITKTKKKI